MIRCIVLSLAFLASVTPIAADDWPQWGGPKRDNVWREAGVRHDFASNPKYLWRTPVGMGYAGPAVAGGKVFVMDRVLGEGASNPADPFGRRPVDGQERVHCLNAETGKVLWTHEYPCRYTVSYPNGPRATPSVDGDRVYTMGAMGDFFCLSVVDGKVHWQKNFVKDFKAEVNIWGFSSPPLVDGDSVIAVAGGPDACVVAFDKMTGTEQWRSLDSKDFGYAPPIIIEEGGVRQLIMWTPTELASIDPKTGKVYWREAFPIKAGLAIPTPAFDAKNHLLLVTAFYNGPKMMQLDPNSPTAKLKWKGSSSSEMKTDKLHSIMSSPQIMDGHIYGVCSYGQLRCLNAQTGARVWETRDYTGSDRWWNAFLVRHLDAYFLANEQGELITVKLDPKSHRPIARMKMLEPTTPLQRRKVVWSHPAFAMKSVFARNDKEIVRIDLSND